MLKRFLIVVAAVAAVLALAAPALAISVHVRVEGKTQTIFGKDNPLVQVKVNALDALDAASASGEFYYHLQQTAFGPYVDQIGRYAATADSGWVFKVNGTSPPVGADGVTLHDGDTVLWYWATFGPSGGPKTLLLDTRKPNCYRARAQDDTGALSAVTATLHVDGRSVATKGGAACVGKHVGLVRATAAGDVRSNALR